MTTVVRRGSVRVTFTPAGAAQLFAVASVEGPASPADAARDAYEIVSGALSSRGFAIVHERIFGSLSAAGEILSSRRAAVESAGIVDHVAPTFVEGRPMDGDGLAGVIVRAVSRALSSAPFSVVNEGVAVGRIWRTADESETLILQGIAEPSESARPGSSKVDEFERLFQRAGHLLRSCGFRYADVVRTWFYVENILSCYSEFNHVRNAHYAAEGLGGLSLAAAALPASTAIGAKNVSRAAAFLDVLAVRGPGRRVEHLSSSEQPEASSYGSAFARGAIVSEMGVAVLELSGTAAIGPAGESLGQNDVAAQIDVTLVKIQALVSAHRASLANAGAVCVFLKRAGDGDRFREALDREGLTGLPYVAMLADVCRDELLLEIDGELVLPRPGSAS